MDQDPAGSSPEAGRSLAVVDIRRMAVDRGKGKAVDQARLGLDMVSRSGHMEMHRSIRWEGWFVACGRVEVWLDRRLGSFGCRKLGELLKGDRIWSPL